MEKKTKKSKLIIFIAIVIIAIVGIVVFTSNNGTPGENGANKGTQQAEEKKALSCIMERRFRHLILITFISRSVPVFLSPDAEYRIAMVLMSFIFLWKRGVFPMM